MIIYYDHYALYLIFFPILSLVSIWKTFFEMIRKKLKKNLFYLYGKLNHILEEANDAIVVKPRP